MVELFPNHKSFLTHVVFGQEQTSDVNLANSEDREANCRLEARDQQGGDPIFVGFLNLLPLNQAAFFLAQVEGFPDFLTLGQLWLNCNAFVSFTGLVQEPGSGALVAKQAKVLEP